MAPIGVGGHFPPEVAFTPQVDLFAIEHQSRDSQTHPGEDGDKSSDGDNFELKSRFNADPKFIPPNAEEFFQTWPESYGEQSGLDPFATSRGIATLPGGVPLYKTFIVDGVGKQVTSPTSKSINLVGGIGVFFPGDDGYATYEQGFRHGVNQSESVRNNAPLVLEAEFAALAAAAGAGIEGGGPFRRDVSDLNRQFAAAGLELPTIAALNGRIDLVGITLEINGPTPTRSHPFPGIDRLLNEGRQRGFSAPNGTNQRINDTTGGDAAQSSQDGEPVPFGWLVAPHDATDGSGLTADMVQQIIQTGVAEANRTRAAIRLDVDNDFRPGPKTSMVLAVADTNGELLGLFRMPDATIFSIDVSVAKARNTAYYADPDAIQDADIVDFNGDGNFGAVSRSLDSRSGDTLPKGTALTSRSFRFLSEPRFPTGTELDGSFPDGCVGNPTPCTEVGPHSMLRLPGINPRTGENLVNDQPLPFSVYASAAHSSTKAFDAFNVMRNFRDPGDASVMIQGTNEIEPLANQNGVVFFPGSTPIYLNKAGGGQVLVGGFGVSGDGVDQDDVVTSAGQQGFAPDPNIRVDAYTLGGVRTPFQKFNRNPFGG